MDISFVITTCGRFDLLLTTLNSFTSYTTCTLSGMKQRIMVDDSGDKEIGAKLDTLYGKIFKIIHNDPKVGLSKSIDKAYNLCKGTYIFHCEDDWEFNSNPNFISDSIKLLKNRPDIHQVWLRHQYDTPHKADVEVLKTGNVEYQMIPEWEGWCGFSWNPGLRRKSDYKEMFPEGFSAIGDELACSKHAQSQGYTVATLLNTSCKHIGYGRHTEGFIH